MSREFTDFTTNASEGATLKCGKHSSTHSIACPSLLLWQTRYSVSMAACPHLFPTWTTFDRSLDRRMYPIMGCSTTCCGAILLIWTKTGSQMNGESATVSE